jgi:hypothetical protein
VVKPTWLLTIEVHRAAGLVALEAAEVERLRDDALADEGRVAVDEQRHHPTHRLALERGVGADPTLAVLLGAQRPSRPGSRTRGGSG